MLSVVRRGRLATELRKLSVCKSKYNLTVVKYVKLVLLCDIRPNVTCKVCGYEAPKSSGMSLLLTKHQ